MKFLCQILIRNFSIRVILFKKKHQINGSVIPLNLKHTEGNQNTHR